MALPEVRRLFAEGRVQIGRSSATRPLDFARAASRMGVSRGITAFQRFGYIERNGQSNLAVPLGRFEVRNGASEHAACLDDIALWMSKLHREAGAREASARLINAARRAADAAFDAASRPDAPLRWQELLLALGQVEAVMKTGSGYRAQPIPPLRPQWVLAADDGSPEFRLALAFALQTTPHAVLPSISIGMIRRHWLPLASGSTTRFSVSGDAQHPRLDKRPEVVMEGRDAIDDAIAMITRRQIETSRAGGRAFPFVHAKRASASLADIGALLVGSIDVSRAFALGRALMALDQRQWAIGPAVSIDTPRSAYHLDDGWICIRLACLPRSLDAQVRAVCDPALIRHLATGDAAGALEIALRRIRAAGVRPNLRGVSVDADTARRWAAALAFPISLQDAGRLQRMIDPSLSKEPRS
jgi:CRISPR-associated protein Csx17